jgi:hypothetical protein
MSTLLYVLFSGSGDSLAELLREIEIQLGILLTVLVGLQACGHSIASPFNTWESVYCIISKEPCTRFECPISCDLIEWTGTMPWYRPRVQAWTPFRIPLRQS